MRCTYYAITHTHAYSVRMIFPINDGPETKPKSGHNIFLMSRQQILNIIEK